MNNLNKLCALILFFTTTVINAQTVEKHTFSTSGGKLAAASTSISFTIGEPIVGNISKGGTILGQGFWAGATAGETLDVATFKNNANGIAVFPNPVKDILYLKYQEQSNLNAQILDINGRSLLRKNLSKTQDQLNLSHLSSGSYFIIISTEQGLQKTIKIIKD